MKKKSMALFGQVLVGTALLGMACAGTDGPPAEPPPASSDLRAPSPSPPGGLAPEEVPQFVAFGWDDNGHLDGMEWTLELVRDRHNPEGTGNARTHDGRPWSMSYYMTSAYGAEPDLAEVWRRAYRQGHELGVHTVTHTTNVTTTLEEWRREIGDCRDFLVQEIGVPREEILGFRTPFLEHNDATFVALRELGLLYDCSLEEGFDAVQEGDDFLWPYTLDSGSPGNELLVARERKQPVANHPGLWELPQHAFVVPPDELCEHYGIEPGFRERLAQVVAYFEPENGKITGFDYNLWYLFHLSGPEVTAILKYTLDRRLAGNRAPFFVGVHSEEYSEQSEPALGSTYLERRRAIEDFLDHAASHEAVRIVAARDVLQWVREPTPLERPALEP